MQDLPTEPGSAGEGAAGKPPRLTRLGHALRQRDWLGIGIEFIVVTLGVLLAFQVSGAISANRRRRSGDF